MTYTLRVASLMVAGVVIAAAAHAQTPQLQRPFQGLFASGAGDAAQSLTVNGSVGGGWDSRAVIDVRPDEVTTPNFITPPRGAGYNSFGGSLMYSHQTSERMGFGASVATSGRYYPSVSDPFLVSHSAQAGLSYQVSPLTSFSVNQSVSYQPFGSLDLFPRVLNAVLPGPTDVPVATAPNLDLRANGTDFFTSNSAASINRQMSRRSTLTGGYGYQISTFGGSAGTFETQSASGRYAYSFTENLSLRLGYGYGTTQFAGSANRFTNHLIDTGINYNRVLSFSRRTTVGFTTGAVGVNDGVTTRYSAVGSAQMLHEMGRTWFLSGSAARTVQFVQNLNQPLFSDGLSLSIGGLLSRRVQVGAGAGAASGNLGFNQGVNDLWSYNGNAFMGFALSRHLNATASYSYNSFTLQGDVYRLLGFPEDVRRHSVGVFLTAWAPLYQKGRRTNASR
jgi:hypothetical protein